MARTKQPRELTYADILGRANEKSLAKTGKPLPLPYKVKLTAKPDGTYRINGIEGLFKPSLLTSAMPLPKERKQAVERNWRRLRALAEAQAVDTSAKADTTS